MTFPITLVILLPLVAVPIVLACGRWLRSRTGYLAALFPLLSFISLAMIALSVADQPRIVVEIPWVPSLGIQLAFLVDGLSLLFGFIVCGMGVLVCWYGAEYLGEKYKEHGRFYAYLLLFMGAMLGTVFADNLLLLFVFWELTGVASFLLIGFLHADPLSRMGARKALLVTGGTGLCLMTGLIMLGMSSGSYSFAQIMDAGLPVAAQGEGWVTVTLFLILLGAFGKSAQFPFFFWLPAAMAAPTPVSAYLHSATMVKLGVYLVARVFPIFGTHELWFPVVAGICFATMLLGAYLAFRSDDLKGILAYSTVSQLGLLIGFYGLGSSIGIRFDFVHILNHVFYKGCLFMVAGIVDHSTGTRDVRQLGGLAKQMPLTAAACLISTAALAGLPLTTGFISKEIILADLFLVRSANPVGGMILIVVVLLSTVLTVAFAARLFFKVFMGPKPDQLHFHRPSVAMQMPPLILGFGLIFFGIFPGFLENPLDRLQVAQLHAPRGAYLKLWHGFNYELLTSFLVLVAGTLLYLWTTRKAAWSERQAPAWLRFDIGFERGLDGLSTLAKKLTDSLQARPPSAYLSLIICTLLLLLGWVGLSRGGDWGEVEKRMADAFRGIEPLRAFVVISISISTIAVAVLKRWTAQLVALSIGGFLITFYFVLYRAPDLAMTQILVESALMVMILLLLSRFPRASQEGVRNPPGEARVFRLTLSITFGGAMSALVVFATANRHADPVGLRQLALSKPLAEGANAVNTILVDFRGFDTLGEIAVLLIATLGGLGLVMRFKRSEPSADQIQPPGFLLTEEKEP